jgi:hypothetical protein
MRVEPIHPALWETTLPAVRAAWAAGREYIASGNKYVPKIGRPQYKENDSGWPATLAPDALSISDDKLTDWSDMFGTAGGQFTRVVIEDVPVLSSAIDHVVALAEADGEFAQGINPFAHSENVEWRESQLRFDYQKNIVAAMIARAEALGVESDDDLLGIYMQLERARYWCELVGDFVAPVQLTDFGDDERIDLGADVHIERLTRDLQCARAPKFVYSREVNPYLTTAATHAVVVRDVKIDNSTYGRRVLGGLYGIPVINPGDVAKVDRAIQAIHVITENPTGYTQTFVRPDGSADRWTADLPPVSNVQEPNNFPPETTAGWNVAREPIERNLIGELQPAFAALTTAPKFVGLAARRSIRAMMRTNDEDRALDATIGIEALLLDNSPELKFRMALRAAAALCDDYHAAAIFALAKNVYDHRSEIAHGAEIKKATFEYDGTTWKSAEIAPFLLRALLRNYLLSTKPWTKSDLDDRVLAALAAYSTIPEPGTDGAQ